MASSFRNLRIIARYNWDYFTIPLNLAATEERFPQRYLVNDYAMCNAAAFAAMFAHAPGDIENASIKEVSLYKKKFGAEHELLFVTVDYHGETITYGVTERFWDGENGMSYEPPCYQSPTLTSLQKSEIIDDASTQPHLNTYFTSDAVYFKSTRARAEMATLHSTLQCTFTPHPISLRYSLIKFFIICGSFTIISQNYPPLSTNSYYYAAVILKLLEDIIGGQIVYRRNNTIGKKKGVTIVDLGSDMVSQVIQEAKQLYSTKWADFEAARSGKKVTMGKTVERTVLPAGTELDATTEQARREIVAEEVISERATEEAARRTRRVVTEHEESDEQEQIQAAQALLAKVTGIPLPQFGDFIANLRAQTQSDSGAAAEGSSGGARGL